MYISANGKWATGVYYDYSYNPFAFRWSLESGKIELLSTLDSSFPSGISDNGVVAANFSSHDISPNGAGVDSPGWYDTRWHTLPLNGKFINISNMGTSMGGGISGGISPDGQWMAASSCINGELHPVVWKNGVFYKDYYDGYTGVPTCISSDGQSVAGWKYQAKKEGTRFACVWRDSKDAEILSNYGAPWCSGQMFSADGKKLVLWGGYASLDENSESDIKALYDMDTHTVSTLRCITHNPFGEDFSSISNDGTILGYEAPASGQSRATIYKEGKGYFAVDYLRDNNIWDFTKDENILNDPTIDDYPMVIRAMGISADSKAMGFFHYEPEGYYQSTVLLLDQELTHRAPCGLQAKQFDGSKVTRISWEKPLTNAANVEKYVVYRNGVKIGECAASQLVYFDSALSNGSYDYSVTAIYNDAAESEKCDPATATIKDKEMQTPYSVIARQNGFNNASMMWNAPRTNKIVKTYYDAEVDDVYGFGASAYSFELAVRYDKEDFKFYEGNKIEGVSFYPMSSQLGWKATIYEYDAATDSYTTIKEEKITQELVLGKLNTVTFAEPITINTQKDVVVGISATVSELTASNSVIGMVYGKCIPGKTDLLRLVSEPKPYSFYDVAQQQGSTTECTWAINLIINDGTVSADADKVASYNIYADGTLVSNVASEYAKVENLSEGKHTLGVEAVYADGNKANVQNADVDVNIQTESYAVNEVKVESKENSSKVAFSWEAPVDNDRNFVAYCSEKPSTQAMRGNETENWALQGLVSYDTEVLRPFVGNQIKAFRFYPTCDAEFTFSLVLNNNIIAYEEVMDYKLNEWNVVELEEPITILPGLSYDLMLDCYDTAPGESPIGIDSDAPFVGVSDLVATDGVNFTSLSDYESSGNWMFGIVTEAEEPSALPISGYNVSIDGELKTLSPISETSFEYDANSLSEGKHTVNVDVVFNGTSKTAKGADNTFDTNSSSGIVNAQSANAGSSSIKYYDVAGRRINKPSVGMFVQKKQKTIASGHQPLNIKK